MQWTKPEFEEVNLAMEVTAYVNTDNPLSAVDKPARLSEAPSRPVERSLETVCTD